MNNKNILLHANAILNERAEEKEREYGPMDESIEKAAKMASILTNKEITTDDFFKCLIALKMSRLSYNDKYDTYLDAISYTAALHQYHVRKSIQDSAQASFNFEEPAQ
jgi:hypothetical protein